VNEGALIPMLKDAAAAGVDLEDVKAIAKECRSWTQFQNDLNYLMFGD